MNYNLKITTSQKVTYNYLIIGALDVDRYIKLVMVAEKCPRRSIVKILIKAVS